MRLFTVVLTTVITGALLAGCSGRMSSMTQLAGSSAESEASFAYHGRYIPHWSYPASVVPSDARPRYHEVLTRLVRHYSQPLRSNNGGIYVAEQSDGIYGYHAKNKSNNPPICSISGPSNLSDIAVDGKRNLIVPDGGTRSVIIYSGPGMCGSKLGSFADPYGQPSDASSADATSGTLAVANIFDNSYQPGSISVCTLAAGCTRNLTASSMYQVAGVAMDKHGNCWASAIDSAGAATLTYFAGCTGSGQQATGYQNSYFGGLDIDKGGNLVSLSAYDSKVYVYSGCNPACRLVGGYTLKNSAAFGHLNRKSTTFAVAALFVGQIDVYHYSPAGLTYWYSFNNGLSSSYLEVLGVAYDPRSAQ